MVDINLDKQYSGLNTALKPVAFPWTTGLQLNADVSLGSLVLNTTDSDGIIWICTDIAGWWGLPDNEIIDIPRGLADGSYDVKGRYLPRQLTLAGSILVPNSSYIAAARDKLVRAIDLVHTGGWLRTNDSPTKASYVRLSGKPEIDVVNARGRINFSIGLRASDPIKYEYVDNSDNGYSSVDIACESTSPVHSGSAVITNIGNTSVPVFFQVSGILYGKTTIKNTTTNETINIVAVQGASDTLEIDTYNRSAYFNNVSSAARSRLDTLVDWIYLAPGQNTITFADAGKTAASTANCRVLYRSGWIG